MLYFESQSARPRFLHRFIEAAIRDRNRRTYDRTKTRDRVTQLTLSSHLAALPRVPKEKNEDLNSFCLEV